MEENIGVLRLDNVQGCCGAWYLWGFGFSVYDDFSTNGELKSSIKEHRTIVDKQIARYIRDVKYKGVLFAMLNKRQTVIFHDIMERHGFRIVSHTANLPEQSEIYMYVLDLNTMESIDEFSREDIIDNMAEECEQVKHLVAQVKKEEKKKGKKK